MTHAPWRNRNAHDRTLCELVNARTLPDTALADQVAVLPVVAVHRAQVPWGKVVTDGVPVVAARRLPRMLRELPAVLGAEWVTDLADQAWVRFHAAI